MELPFEKLGYEVIEEIPNTERNACYRLRKDGRDFFAKVNLTEDPSRVANELWWSKQARPLLIERAEIIIPEFYESGANWFVSEWIEGSLLVGRGDPVGGIIAASPRLAGVLLAMDRTLAPLTAPTTKLGRWRVDEWIDGPLEAGIITNERVRVAKDLIARYSSYVTAWPQHGDFVPWHIMVKPSGDWVLFDAEHADPAKPRYYDLAYLYSRVFTRLQSPVAAASILQEFLKLHATPEFTQAFLPVITQRALGMHFDSLHDEAFGNYTAPAQRLLDLCLAENLSAFL